MRAHRIGPGSGPSQPPNWGFQILPYSRIRPWIGAPPYPLPPKAQVWDPPLQDQAWIRAFAPPLPLLQDQVPLACPIPQDKAPPLFPPTPGSGPHTALLQDHGSSLPTLPQAQIKALVVGGRGGVTHGC